MASERTPFFLQGCWAPGQGGWPTDGRGGEGKASEEREIERLREVLLGSVSSRLAAQDLEKFMEEVEKKYREDGWKWAERPPEALEIWLRERLQEAGEEWTSQEETQDEPSE